MFKIKRSFPKPNESSIDSDSLQNPSHNVNGVTRDTIIPETENMTIDAKMPLYFSSEIIDELKSNNAKNISIKQDNENGIIISYVDKNNSRKQITDSIKNSFRSDNTLHDKNARVGLILSKNKIVFSLPRNYSTVESKSNLNETPVLDKVRIKNNMSQTSDADKRV